MKNPRWKLLQFSNPQRSWTSEMYFIIGVLTGLICSWAGYTAGKKYVKNRVNNWATYRIIEVQHHLGAALMLPKLKELKELLKEI